MFDVTTVTTQGQLKEVQTTDLLAAFNRLTGKSTKKFASRAKGEVQTFKAIEAARKDGKLGKAKAKAKGKATPGRNRALSFRLAPAKVDEQQVPRAGSTREKAFSLIRSAGDCGALFSKVMETTGWSRKDAYEGIRLINLHNGFGLWSDQVGEDDYRIRIVDHRQFTSLAAKADKEQE